MSTAYKIIDQDVAHFLTFQIVGWVDIFSRKIYKDIVIDSFKFCQENKGLQLFAYVIMTNHIHLIARSEKSDLSGFIRDFKNFTSGKIIDILNDGIESRKDWMKMVFEYHGKFKNNQHYQIWTNENHAEILYSPEFITQKISYIHNNPVKAGIDANPEDYLYSSARNYANLENVLDIIRLDLQWKTY